MALEVCENTLKQNMMNYNLTTALSPRHTRVLRIPGGTDSTSVSAGSAGSKIDPANLDQPPLDHNMANSSGPETPQSLQKKILEPNVASHDAPQQSSTSEKLWKCPSKRHNGYFPKTARNSNNRWHYSINQQQSPPQSNERVTATSDNKTYEPTFGRGNRPRITRPRPHERYQESRRLFQETFTDKYYKKYFIIKATSGENLAEINVIKSYKYMTTELHGKPKLLSELRDGSLLVEVTNEEQSCLITNIRKLECVDVVIAEYSTLNQIQGTIGYRNLPKFTNE